MTVPQSPQQVINVVDNKISQGKGVVAQWCSSNWRPILAEFVSTALLLLVGCMTTIPIDGRPYQNEMYAPVGFGLVVLFNIQIFGHISGAFMNPAVTLAALLWGSISISKAIAYVIAEIIGAILGFGILTTLSPILVSETGVCVSEVHPQLNALQAIGIEIVLTTALNFVNCGIWDPVNKDKPDSVPIKFGLTIAGLSLAGGPLTGASMNPVRSLAPAVWTGRWDNHWVYWVGPLIGGIIPTFIYKFMFLGKKLETAE